NKNKTKGVDVDDKEINQKIYNQYVEAFKKGVANYLKDEYDPATQSVISRKYFSGGLNLDLQPSKAMVIETDSALIGEQTQRELTEGNVVVKTNCIELTPKTRAKDVDLATLAPRAPPITYPKTTAAGWHKDVISLVTSPLFLELAKKGG